MLASVSPRITRVAIDPQYQVSVTPDAMLLRARLKCRVRDGSLQRLKIDLQDWVVDDESWGPAGLVADNSLIGARLQPLIVPFQRPLTGEFELHFEARRSIASDGKQVEFALPRPEGTLVGQAQLVVTAADNVRLAPAAESQMKLIAQRPDASVNLPALRQPPHFFLGDVAEARFAAGFEVREREVHAKVQAQATLQGSRVAVRQRLRYQIENEGLDRARLRIPRAILAAGNLRLTLLDAEPVPLAVASLENSTDEPTTVFLPRKYLGELELEARFDLPIAEGAKAWELPLIQPAEVVDDGAELELVTPAGLESKLAGADWVFENLGSDAASDRWTTAKSPRQIAIELRRSENRAPNEDLVERAWVQSQLVGNRRQDRVVWRVVAPDGELQVQLPEGVRARDVLILLDGAPISAGQTSEGLLRLTWPANQGAAHSVELDYRLDDLAGDRVRELPPARLAAAGRMKQVYWELLLPAQEHLIDVSAAYQLEYAWTWQGGYWARTPTRSTSELRAWSGASERDALPTNSNRYVLSTFGDLAPLDARVGARSALLLTSSTVLLAAGLLSMFAPAWLRSGSQFALSVGVVVLLALAGELGPLLLQSAAPGVACLAMAWGVHGWQHRRRGHQPLLQGSTHARHVSSLAERSTGVASASSHTSRRIAVQAVPSDLS